VVSAPPANTTYRVYYYAGGKPIAMRVMPPNDATGTLYYLHSDHLGSTSVTTNASGGVVARQWYYPYGSVRASTGTLPTKRTYTGQIADDTGLYFYNARYYASGLGRFVSADTIVPEPGNPQAFNRYMYALGNPIRYVDPSGHCPAPPEGSGRVICFALFIAPPRMPVAGGVWTLHGDNRSFSSNSNPDASRLWMWLNVDEGTVTIGIAPSGYLRREVVGGYAVGSEYMEWHEPSSQNKVTISLDEDGYYVVNYDVVLSGPLENIAPRLNGTVVFAPDGLGGYTGKGVRDGFPWAEAYYHDGKGNVQTLFKRSAILGDPENLNAIEPSQPVQFANLSYHLRKLGLVDLPLWARLRSAPRQDTFGPPSCQPNRPC
jgi:RHS repeat-associated protein